MALERVAAIAASHAGADLHLLARALDSNEAFRDLKDRMGAEKSVYQDVALIVRLRVVAAQFDNCASEDNRCIPGGLAGRPDDAAGACQRNCRESHANQNTM